MNHFFSFCNYLIDHEPGSLSNWLNSSLNYFIVLKYYKPDAIHMYHRIVGKELGQKIHKRGMKAIVYTVNDKEKLEKLISMNIDGVFTDNPKILEQVNQKVHQNIL